MLTHHNERDPTSAWEDRQRDLAHRTRVEDIANYVCNTRPWAQSYHFATQLRNKANLQSTSRLLDAGCGSGQLAFAAAVNSGCRVTLLDYSSAAVAFSRAVGEELGRRGKGVAGSYVQGNLENLTFQDRFDIVVNQGVLEHWLTPDARLRVLREMAKVTKPGGTVMVWVPNNHNPFYRRWIRTNAEVPEVAFSVGELKGMIADAGLEQVQVYPARGYASFIHHLGMPKMLGAIVWLLETAVLRFIPSYMTTCGYELIGIGRKPMA